MCVNRENMATLTTDHYCEVKVLQYNKVILNGDIFIANLCIRSMQNPFIHLISKAVFNFILFCFFFFSFYSSVVFFIVFIGGFLFCFYSYC